MRAKRAGGAHGELSSPKSSVVPEKITTAPLCLIEHVLHVVHRDKVHHQSAERMKCERVCESAERTEATEVKFMFTFKSLFRSARSPLELIRESITHFYRETRVSRVFRGNNRCHDARRWRKTRRWPRRPGL